MNDRVPVDELAKLAELKANGSISDEEFQKLKRFIFRSRTAIRVLVLDALCFLGQRGGNHG